MVDPDRSLLSGWVEIGETFIPYRTKQDSIAGSKGRIRLAAIPDFSRQTLHGFLHSTVADAAAPGTAARRGERARTRAGDRCFH